MDVPRNSTDEARTEKIPQIDLPQVLERMTDAFVALNGAWQYTYVSKKAAELFGRRAEELIGKHIWTEFPDGVGQRFHNAYYQSLAEQIPISIEEYYPPWDRWFENRIFPSKDGLTIFFTEITERKKLEENRVRLDILMEGSPDLVLFADADGKLLHLNPGGRRMLSIPPTAPNPPSLYDCIPERLHKRHVEEWIPAATRDGVWRGDGTVQAQDGREIPVTQAILVHRQADGSLDSISIMARDMSERHQAEHRLRESEARYRTIVENAPEAIVVLDLNARRFVDFNDNALRLFGMTREQLSLLGPVEVSPPVQTDGRPSAEAAAPWLAEAARGGRPVFDWVHRNARGIDFPCEVRLVRIPSAGSVLIRGSIIDISERKRGEDALRESEARFRQIAETIRDVFWVGTPDLGEIHYVSPAFEEVWGRPRKELYRAASTWNEAIHPDDGGRTLRTVPANGRLDNTYRIIRPDGGLRWIRERGFPILDANGGIDRMVGIAEDVTELMDAEADLRESRRQLEEALRTTQDRVVQLEEQVRGRTSFGRMIGKSAPIQDVYRRLRLAGQSPVNVLLLGESGTGKELSARAIHDLGSRKNQPFIAVNCAAIPEALLESEMFGHVKGAFTGAVRDKVGLFQSGDGGTLFLDEVGDMPAALQVKVLRALQEREIQRVGDDKPIKVDLHLITATNRNPQALLSSGEWREDFFYRIRVFEIRLPPLRERKDDIPLLVSHFMEHFSLEKKKKIRGISAEAMRRLMDYPWPGNIRELRNAIEYAYVTVAGDSLTLGDFPAVHLALPAPTPTTIAATAGSDPERARIEEALRKVDGNRAKAAQLLGYSRVTLWKNMRRYGLWKDRP